MKRCNALFLTNNELIVLAALMNKDYIYGVHSNLLKDWRNDDSSIIDSIIKNLEDKKYIHIDYAGVLHIDSFIYDLVNDITTPDCILSVTNEYLKGGKSNIVYYRKDNRVYELQKNTLDSTIISQCKSTICFDFSYLNINETIKNEDVVKVKNYIKSFDKDSLINYLKEITVNKDVSINFFEQNYDAVNLEYIEWLDKNVLNSITCKLAVVEGKAFEWFYDEYNNLHFCNHVEQINRIIQLVFQEE